MVAQSQTCTRVLANIQSHCRITKFECKHDCRYVTVEQAVLPILRQVKRKIKTRLGFFFLFFSFLVVFVTEWKRKNCLGPQRDRKRAADNTTSMALLFFLHKTKINRESCQRKKS